MKRTGSILLLAALLAGTGFQDEASDAKARARALVIPIQATESGKTLLSAGVLLHADGLSGLVAASIPKFKYERLNLEKATIACTVSGKSVPASIVCWMEDWGIALLSIKSEGLPKPPEFAREPQPGLFANWDKLIAGGLAREGRTSRAEAGPPVETSAQGFGPAGAGDSPVPSLQLTFSTDSLDPVGGPVLDDRGRLVAVIARYTGGGGKQTSFSAVCAWSLESLLTGLIGKWTAEFASREPDRCRIKIQGTVSNPLGRVREMRAAHSYDKIQDSVNQVQPVFVEAGVIGPFAPLMVESRLDLEGNRFTGEVVVSKDAAAGKDCVLQVRLLVEGAYSRYSRPRYIPLSFPEAPKSGPVPDDWMEANAGKKREEAARSGRFALRTVVNVDASFTQIGLPAEDLVPDLLWGDEGKTLFVLEKGGILRRIAVPSFQQEFHQDFGYECRALQMSREGLLVLGRNRAELALVDPRTLQIKSRISIEPSVSLASSPKSTWALAGAVKERMASMEIQVVDLLEGKKIAAQTYQIRGSDGPRPVTWDRISLSPDGRALAAWDNYGLHRFRFSRDRLVYEEYGPVGFSKSDDDQILWSPDSLYLATSNRAGDNRDVLVYKSASIKETLMRLKVTGWGTGFGFDPVARSMYGAGRSKALAIYDARGTIRKEYPLWPESYDFVQKVVVHPDGHRLLAIGKGIVVWVEWPK